MPVDRQIVSVLTWFIVLPISSAVNPFSLGGNYYLTSAKKNTYTLVVWENCLSEPSRPKPRLLRKREKRQNWRSPGRLGN